MKVYELMNILEHFPSGAEVMCSGVKTMDELISAEPIGEDDKGSIEYPITESIVDVDLEGKRVYLQF